MKYTPYWYAWKWSDCLAANVYILPPADPECSDEDSGDEDKVAPDNLSRRQLEAEGEATVWKEDERVRLFSPDNNDDETVATRQPSAPPPTPSSTSAPASASRQHRGAKTVQPRVPKMSRFSHQLSSRKQPPQRRKGNRRNLCGSGRKLTCHKSAHQQPQVLLLRLCGRL